MVLKIDLENMEKKFRELAMRKYGFYKGSIKKAGNEAIKLWIELEEPVLPTIKNPINSIKGIMKHVKKRSVELQHESLRLWK